MTLLSGARNQKNSELSQNVFNRMRKLFPDLKNSLIPASILLANAYASTGDTEKSSRIRNQLHHSSSKKIVGISLTEIDGQIIVSLKKRNFLL